MGINLVVAVTDDDWFEMLRRQPNLNEVNFWAPSASNFRALQPGELFLFKLHAPRNVVVGGGVFAYLWSCERTIGSAFVAWPSSAPVTLPHSAPGSQPAGCADTDAGRARRPRLPCQWPGFFLV